MFVCHVISRKGSFSGEGDAFNRINAAIRKICEAEAKIQVKLYKRTVAYWKGKPEFGYEIRFIGDEVEIEVGTDDNVYKFIDKGTRVRRALMSEDFMPKTSVRHLGNARGRGYRVAISKKINKPGIVAREFSEMIADMRKPIFWDNFEHYIIPYAMDILRGKAGPPPNRYWR